MGSHTWQTFIFTLTLSLQKVYQDCVQALTFSLCQIASTQEWERARLLSAQLSATQGEARFFKKKKCNVCFYQTLVKQLMITCTPVIGHQMPSSGLHGYHYPCCAIKTCYKQIK